MTLQLVADDLTPLPPIFSHLRLVEAAPYEADVTYITIPAPQVKITEAGGYDAYPGSLFPGQVDRIRNHPHPQTPDAIMAIETFLLGNPTFPGGIVIDGGNVSVVPPGAFVGNGSVPPGGLAGQVLTKATNADYALVWTTPSSGGGGIPLPLGQNLTFAPDATYNIGTPSANRPNNVYAATRVVVGDPSQTATLNIDNLTAAFDFKIRSGTGTPVAIQSGNYQWNFSGTDGSFKPNFDNTYDIGDASTFRPRNIYAGTAFIGPGALPTGGTTGQALTKTSNANYAVTWSNVLTQAQGDARYALIAQGLPVGGTAGQVLQKNSATNYDTVWITPATALSWPLQAPDGAASNPQYSFANNPTNGLYSNGGISIGFAIAGTARAFIGSSLSLLIPIQFGTDNTYDIGAVSSSRPRNVYVAGNGVFGGTMSLGGNLTFATDNAFDIGASAANRPRNIYVAGNVDTTFVGPSAVGTLTFTTGGTSRWQVNSSGHFVAMADSAYDIGLNGSNRPRDVYIARSLMVSGTEGIGVAASGSNALTIQSSNLTGNAQWGMYCTPMFSSAATAQMYAIHTNVRTATASYSTSNAAAIQIAAPFTGSGHVVTNMFGIRIQNPGLSSVTNAYSLWIEAVSGAATTNIGLANLGTTYFGGVVSIGLTPPYTGAALTVQPPAGMMTGAVQFQIIANGVFSSAATTQGVVANFSFATQAASFTMNAGYGVFIGGPTIGAGSTVTTMTGLYIANQTVSGVTNAGGIYIETQTGGTGSIYFGSRNEYIRNPANAATNLSIESSDGYTLLSGKAGSQLGGNAYWDGTNWNRYDVSQPATVWVAQGNGNALFLVAPAGANPATLTTKFQIDAAGNVTVGNNLIVTYNTIYLFSDLQRSFYANGNTISYRCVPTTGNHSFEFSGGGYADVVCRNALTNGYLMAQGTNSISGAISGAIYYHPNMTVYSYLDGGNGYHFYNLSLIANAFTPASARKLKTDIRPISDPLSLVLDERVHGVRYTEIASGEPKIGFVADDWVPVETSLVRFDHNDEVDCLDYDRIGAITFEALKQYVIATNARLDALERRLAA